MKLETFSEKMFDQTERPGQLFPIDTHQIIKHRYYTVLPLAKDKDVLEIGAGHGMGSKLLSANAKSYTAGEYSKENLDILKNRNFKGNVVQVDAHQMPFEDNSFDVVIALAMIYYLDIEKFLKEVRRVLRPNGVLFFCTSNKDVPGFVPSPYTIKYFSIPEFDQILKNNKLQPRFKGAFEASGGNDLVRLTKAHLKNSAKRVINALPGGNALWLSLRKSSQGDFYPLPENIEEIKYENELDAVELASNSIDRKFRIIYCFAEKA